MSETVAVVLISAGFPSVVAILSLFFQWLRGRQESTQRLAERREDYQEWYRRTLFKRQLAAVQEAYTRLMKLNVALNNADPQQPNSEENEAVRRLAKEGREWYDHNTVYLEDGLPGVSSFIGLTNSAYAWASGHSGIVRIWDDHTAVLNEVKRRAKALIDLEHERDERRGR